MNDHSFPYFYVHQTSRHVSSSSSYDTSSSSSYDTSASSSYDTYFYVHQTSRHARERARERKREEGERRESFGRKDDSRQAERG
jgi:hypothetical protein